MSDVALVVKVGFLYAFPIFLPNILLLFPTTSALHPNILSPRVQLHVVPFATKSFVDGGVYLLIAPAYL